MFKKKFDQSYSNDRFSNYLTRPVKLSLFTADSKLTLDHEPGNGIDSFSGRSFANVWINVFPQESDEKEINKQRKNVEQVWKLQRKDLDHGQRSWRNLEVQAGFN